MRPLNCRFQDIYSNLIIIVEFCKLFQGYFIFEHENVERNLNSIGLFCQLTQYSVYYKILLANILAVFGFCATSQPDAYIESV